MGRPRWRSGVLLLAAVAGLSTALSGADPAAATASGNSVTPAVAPGAIAPSATGSGGPMTASPEMGAAPKTTVFRYEPFKGSHLKAALHVTARYRASSCFQYGGGVAGRYYYQCFAESPGGVYDPCFAGPRGISGPLVCPANPTGHSVTVLTVASSASVGMLGSPWTSLRAWAIQVSGGKVCLFVDAAWGGLGPYDCEAYGQKGFPADCHLPTMGRTWVAACQADKSRTSPFRSVRVVRAWL